MQLVEKIQRKSSVVPQPDMQGKIVSNYFGDHLCSSTVVGITELLTDSRLILEITAVAYI